MVAVTSIPAGSQISPGTERVYHQTRLLGDWKGTWSKDNRPVEFKVLNIKGSTAQVEYTHGGQTERGTATVNGSTITFGNVTIGTRDGSKAALEFSYGTTKNTAILDKTTAPVDENKLVGSWIGSTATMSVTFKVVSISGRDAQVKYSINGQSGQGTGDLFKNVVTFGKLQVSSNDGVNGTVTYQAGHKTLTLAVKKFTPPTSSSSSSGSVNRLA